jgi:hypothetical protein
MLEQPWSVVEGTAMAAAGSAMLGMGRARYATLLIPLMYGGPEQQRVAADAYERLSQALREHPELIQASVKDVHWTNLSADLFNETTANYSNDVAAKADAPKATADTLRVTAGVYDALGYAAFGLGAAILTAGVMHQVAQVNPFLRPAAVVGATMFGRKADQQAGRTAAKGKAAVEGGKGLLGKVLGKLMTMSPAKKLVLAGGAAVMGGMAGQTAVASDLTANAIQPNAAAGVSGRPPVPGDAATKGA